MLVFFSWVQNSLPRSFVFPPRFFSVFSKKKKTHRILFVQILFHFVALYLYHPCYVCLYLLTTLNEFLRYTDEYTSKQCCTEQHGKKIDCWIQNEKKKKKQPHKKQTFMAESFFYNAKTTAKTALTH